MRRIASAILLTLSLALAACSGQSESGPARAEAREGRNQRPEQPPVPVAVAPATVGSITSTYTATATLQADAEANVLARVSGVVRSIQAEEGEQKGKNASLLQVENEEYALRVRQAEARVANLRSRFDRLTGMVEKNLVSQEEFDTAKSELASAEADEGLARLELGYTTVRAPFSGRIVERMVDVGQNVSVGTPLFRLADFDPLLAEVHVPSKEFRSLKTEQPVTLVLDSDDTRLEGRIKLVSPIIDPNSGTIKVTVEIPSHPEGVRPGDFAEVRIVTERREGRTLVPRAAVVTEKGESVLFVESGGKAERRVVTIGFGDELHFEIIDGVAPSELVVVKGQRSLRHGQAVRVLSDATGGGTSVVGAE